MAARARDILLRLTGDPADAKRALNDVKGDLDTFDKIQAEARADIEIAGAKAKLERFENQLVRLSKQEATPAVQIKAAQTVRTIEKLEADLKRLDGKRANVTIDVDERRPRGGAGGSGLGAGAAGAAGGLAAKAGAIGAGVAVGGLALKKSADASVEAEKSAARLSAQLRALGIDYDKNAAKIDTQIQKVSDLSGLDDEDLADSFTNVVRVTGDVEKSLNLVGLAADFARAKNIDVAKAGEIVAKVAGGNVGVLSRYGIQIDKGATSTEALGKLQEKFAGQAEAYGKTTGGAMDRAGVAAENLSEEIGDGLRPVLTALADAFVDVVAAIRENFPKAKEIVQDVVDSIRRFFKRNAKTISDTVEAIKDIFGGLVRSIRGAVRVITGILTGDFGKAWDGVKEIFSGAVDNLGGIIRLAAVPIKKAGAAIGNALKSGIRGALDGIKDIAISVVNGMIDVVNKGIGAINKVSPFGDVGKIDKIKRPGGAPQTAPGAPARSPGGFRLPPSARSAIALPSPSLAGAFSAGSGMTIENVQVTLPPAPAASVPDARHQASQLVRYLEQMGR